MGQSVMARNFGSGSNWVLGVIVRQLGPVTYLVDVSEGRVWKRHVDHLKELVPDHDLSASESDFDMDIPSTATPENLPSEEPVDSTTNGDSSQPEPANSPSSSGTASPSTAGASTESTATNSQTPPPRHYLSRQHQPPSQFGDTQTW